MIISNEVMIIMKWKYNVKAKIMWRKKKENENNEEEESNEEKMMKLMKIIMKWKKK